VFHLRSPGVGTPSKPVQTTIKSDVAGFSTSVSESKTTLIHYHGPGMPSGSVNNSVPKLTKIVEETGVPILSVDYTLVPTAGVPIQVVEWYATSNCLVENREFGIDPKTIGVMGESASGGLAACLVHWTIMRLIFIDCQTTSLLNHTPLTLRKSRPSQVLYTDPNRLHA